MRTLDVLLGERPVGTIVNLENDLNIFTFDPGYREDPNRPTLSLSFYDEKQNLSIPTKTPQVKLLPYFANLLPEGHLRSYLAKHLHVNAERDFPLLMALGEDLPGAVVVRDREGTNARADDDTFPEVTAGDPAVLKFSLAGVQLKFSAVLGAKGRLTIPAHGRNGEWILKMPSAVYANVPENEFAMMTFAHEVGIDVPEIRLIDPAAVRNLPAEIRSDLGRALAVKRFDRVGERRIHTEDFAQIFNQYPAQKYKNVSYGNMLTGIWRVMGEEQTREFVRRLIFSIGIGNADMHLKNWSVVYADGKTPRLSPAYDYVSTIAYIEDDTLALTIARTKEWAEITYDLLERFARRAEVPRGVVLEPAKEMAARMRDAWPRLRGELELSDAIVAKIDAHMNAVPIFGNRKVALTSAKHSER
jgi:serine/threonine-protein kinase HipA